MVYLLLRRGRVGRYDLRGRNGRRVVTDSRTADSRTARCENGGLFRLAGRVQCCWGTEARGAESQNMENGVQRNQDIETRMHYLLSDHQREQYTRRKPGGRKWSTK